jgi:hypothetical protein
MRLKFGDSHGRHELPDTPAACWALVLSTQKSSPQQEVGVEHSSLLKEHSLTYSRLSVVHVTAHTCVAAALATRLGLQSSNERIRSPQTVSSLLQTSVQRDCTWHVAKLV